MSRSPQRRLDVQPMLDWCAAHPVRRLVEAQDPGYFAHRARPDRWEPITPIGTLAILMETTKRTIHRYIHEGVPLSKAEDFCDRIGEHPVLLWGFAYHDEEVNA